MIERNFKLVQGKNQMIRFLDGPATYGVFRTKVFNAKTDSEVPELIQKHMILARAKRFCDQWNADKNGYYYSVAEKVNE